RNICCSIPSRFSSFCFSDCILLVLLSLSLILFKLFASRQWHLSLQQQLLQICRLLLMNEQSTSRFSSHSEGVAKGIRVS
ncbi:hypothetical protein PMAYCL1PPCAC_08401, partial [Pristionchus mayeri]